MEIERLTSAQQQAILRRGGPILVSAAAGSGKTLVIVERLMRYVLNDKDDCSINDFLIITFTKKAAAELRARIARELAKRLAEQPDNIHLQKQQNRIYLTKISTVHAFCADLLREFSHSCGVPSDFRMLEQTEAAALRERLAAELLDDRYASIDEDTELRKLVDGLGAGRDDRRIPRLLLDVYLTAQCHLDPEKWLSECEHELDLLGISVAEQTAWGKDLITSVQDSAQELLQELEQLRLSAERSDCLGKYVPLLAQNAEMLRQFSNISSWDTLYRLLSDSPDLGKLPPVRNCTDPELQNRVKSIRKEIAAQLDSWMHEIYGPSKMVLEDLAQTGDMLRALFSLTRDFSANYQKEKLRLHALDFNDLEHEAVHLLLMPDGVTPTPEALQIAQRFREIMVDEYQDTNQVQDSIFRALSRKGKNRFMVGDVKQSIYRFRLADPGIFVAKYKKYPDADSVEDGGAQRILLSHNFRSGEAILDAVNDVFRNCMSNRVGGLQYGASEQLRAGCAHAELPDPQVEFYCLNTKQESEEAETPDKIKAEAGFAAMKIRSMLDAPIMVRDGDQTRNADASDFVILLRSPKNSAGIYLEALKKQGIPAVSDSGESLMDSAEVETFLSILKVLDNAHQDIPLTAVLLSPAFGVKASDLAKARKSNVNCDLFDAVCSSRSLSVDLDQAVEKILTLRSLVQELPLYSLMEQVLVETDLEGIYGAKQQSEQKKTNLRLFCELAATFCEGGKKSLYQFLRYVEQLREEGGVTVPVKQSNAVRVMSIHKSKGLEFPIVFLCELSKRFNLEDLQSQVLLDSELGAGSNVYDSPTHTRFASISKASINRKTQEDNLSEELRILYVAMTRAKDRLVMTYCSGTMEHKLKSIALRLSSDNTHLLAARASCLGDWILQTALLHTEAGALHEIAGKPDHTELPNHPWKIGYIDVSDLSKLPSLGVSVQQTIAVSDYSDAIQSVLFAYPNQLAVNIPSKITATQLKGRALDEEADDGRSNVRYRQAKLRQPSLIDEGKPLTPAQRGTAMHLAMQYLDFSKTETRNQIKAQLDGMVENHFITSAQAEAVDPDKLLRVFCGPLGELLRSADETIREFKFSILVPASDFFPNAGADQILLQGVTDCCLIKNRRLTVIDFKTDRILAGTEQKAGEKYRPQLDAYSRALERIYGLPVNNRILYFFSTDQMIVL